MYLATVATYAGVSMTIEHPARATWKPQAASSWGLPETRALARHSDVTLVTIDQGAYGADAKKATTLMLVHLPELAAAVQQAPHRGRCAQHPGLTTALGRIEGTTEFRAAHLKECPPELCKLMADALAGNALASRTSPAPRRVAGLLLHGHDRADRGRLCPQDPAASDAPGGGPPSGGRQRYPLPASGPPPCRASAARTAACVPELASAGHPRMRGRAAREDGSLRRRC